MNGANSVLSSFFFAFYIEESASLRHSQIHTLSWPSAHRKTFTGSYFDPSPFLFTNRLPISTLSIFLFQFPSSGAALWGQPTLQWQQDGERKQKRGVVQELVKILKWARNLTFLVRENRVEWHVCVANPFLGIGYHSVFEAELQDVIPICHATIAGTRIVGRLTAGWVLPFLLLIMTVHV